MFPVMTKLSDELLNQINDKKAGIIDLLPIKNIIPNTYKIIRGQYSLQSVYYFGPGDILLLAGKIFGISAKYMDRNNSAYTFILIPYVDSDTCMMAFRNLITNLTADIRIIERSETKISFIDLESKYGTVKISDSMMELVVNQIVVERH
jgi:hypothetical protein